MREASVLFKGIRGGLEIHIENKSEIEQVKSDILEKLRDRRKFFASTAVNLVFTGRKLKSCEKGQLIGAICSEIELGDIEFKEGYKRLEEVKVETPSESQDDTTEIFTGIDEGMTRFITATIRNGQLISYEGNVVITGDVNPGAEIVAEGNIVILGTLRGMAHAGVSGNKDATISCFRLQPTQIRIANLISRPPEDEDNMQPIYPEIVYVKDDILVIEPVK